MLGVPLPRTKTTGQCFKAIVPDTDWTEVPCVPVPQIPQIPSHGGGLPSAVGSGVDHGATAYTDIAQADGSFPQVTNVTSVTDVGGAMPTGAADYSVQVNTNNFTTPKCVNAMGMAIPNCVGWQQFLFDTYMGTSFIGIQYWLINYGRPCPAGGWMANGGSNCYLNSTTSPALPAVVPISQLGNITPSGVVNPAPTSSDAVRLNISGGAFYSYSQASVLTLGPGWRNVEFGFFGVGSGSQARINDMNPTVRVRTGLTLVNGTKAAPACSWTGTTGETNNLTLVPGSCCPTKPLDAAAQPYIEFIESGDPSVHARPCLLNSLQPILSIR
jgi:hypothetical protein